MNHLALVAAVSLAGLTASLGDARAQNIPLSIRPPAAAIDPGPVRDVAPRATPPAGGTVASFAPQLPAAAPLPLPRPAGLGGTEVASAPAQVVAAPVAPAPVPVTPASAQVPAQVAAVSPAAITGPISERAAVERVSAYFNSFSTLTGNFVQTNPNGSRVGGTFYVQKPGRLRFDYNKPSPLEIIADGTSVAIRDRRLNTQDVYSLSQTPLKFLLNQRIDLSRDLTVKNVEVTPEVLRVAVEDRSTLGGTSLITLIYDRQTESLRQWSIVDAQGVQTTVALSNLDTNRRPDPSLFRINNERLLEVR